MTETDVKIYGVFLTSHKTSTNDYIGNTWYVLVLAKYITEVEESFVEV